MELNGANSGLGDGRTRLGSGSYGDVYLSKFKGQNVAEKKVALSKIQAAGGDENLCSLQHSNVVKLFDAKSHGQFRLVIFV